MSSLARRGVNTFRPQLEILEDRLAPSVAVTTIDSDGNGTPDTMRIIADPGDTASQTLKVRYNYASGNTLVMLDANGDGDYTDPGDLFNAPFATPTTSDTYSFDIQMGGGDDYVVFRPFIGISHGTLNVSVDLGSGNDRFGLEDGTPPTPFDNAKLQVQVQAGDGDDWVRVDDVPHIENGSSYLANVDLGTGNNIAVVNMDSDISGGSTYAVSVQGSNRASDVDRVRMLLNANIFDNSVVSYSASLWAGNDQFTGTVGKWFNQLGAASVARVSVAGGEGDDSLTMISASSAGGSGLVTKGLLDISLKGGAGNDTVSVDFTAGAGLQLEGTFQLRASGGKGADALDVRLKNTAASTGNYVVSLQGGLDDDTLSLALNTAGAPLFYPAGFLLVDGGDGLDQATPSVTPGVPLQVLNCE